MIIPLSHESDAARRAPLVTWVIMGACALVFLATGGLGDPVQDAFESRLEDAFAYWEEHPYLEPPDRLEAVFGDPGERARADFHEAWQRNGVPPVPEALLSSEQAALDGLVRESYAILRGHTWYRFGLVATSPTVQGIFGHMFLHGGWLHLLGNLLFLFLCGPLVEDRYGRRIFAAFYLCAGLAGAALFVARHPGFEEPLIGASGAIAGAMGAFLVRFARSQIRFFYFLGFFFGTFRAPAGLMLPLWFAHELFAARLGEVAGGAGGTAYWAHVGGFVFGALAALALKQLGAERPEPERLEEEEELPIEEGDVFAASAELRERRPRDAVELLRGEVLDGGDDTAPALAFAEAAAASAPVHDASEVVAIPLAAATARGEKAPALRIWRSLCRAVPAPQTDAETGLRLAGWLRAAGDLPSSRAALWAALRDGDAACGARVARAAKGSDPVLAYRAARHAISLGGLSAEERAPLAALATEAARVAEAQGIIVVSDAPGGGTAGRPVADSGVRRDAPAAARPARSVAAAGSDDPWADRALELADEGAAGPTPTASAPDELDPMALELADDGPAQASAATEVFDPSSIDLAREDASEGLAGDSAPLASAALDGAGDDEPTRLGEHFAPLADGLELTTDEDEPLLGDGALAAALADAGELPGPDDDLFPPARPASSPPEESPTRLVERPDIEASADDRNAALEEPTRLEMAAPELAAGAPEIPAGGAELATGEIRTRDAHARRPLPDTNPGGPAPEQAATRRPARPAPPIQDDREEKPEALPPARPLRVLSATPAELTSDHLWLEVTGRGRTRLPWGRIEGVALAGVRGLGRPRGSSDRPRAVVVVDLAMNWSAGSGELVVIRLRSDGFDPRRMVPESRSPLEAIRRLVSELVQRSRAAPLTVAAGSPDAALHVHESLPAYEADVLGARLR